MDGGENERGCAGLVREADRRPLVRFGAGAKGREYDEPADRLSAQLNR